MKKILLSLILLYSIGVYGQGFAPSTSNWQTPIGGYYTNGGTNIGYITLNNSISYQPNSQSWGLLDINGDGKTDLIVPSEYQTSVNWAMQYGVGTSPYWKVYLNTGSGMSNSAINWPTPTGGFYNSSGVNYGYMKLFDSGSSTNNSENWSLIDMNGDSKPDLVISAAYQAGTGMMQFGSGTSPYWKVYLNTGTGFSTTSLNWVTPIGGYYSSTGVNYGYYNIGGGNASAVNSQNWSISDMNGDGKPDLVVTAVFQTSVNWAMQFGAGTSPYWKVYLNNGSGFSTSATTWATPVGGFYNSSGVSYGYMDMFGSAPSSNNSQTWGVMDMDGDSKPELVIPSDYQSANGGEKQFGVGGNPYWKVYNNTGTGFSTNNSTWNTPVGGYYTSSGVNLGFSRFSSSNASYANCQNWNILDITGDKKPDLIVHSQFMTSTSRIEQYGVGSSPYWKIYVNSGNSFASSVTNWTTPVGGYYNSNGVNQGYVGLAESNPSNNNSQEWNVLDINGDDKADLIVPSEYQSTNGGTSQYGASVNPYWKVYLNSGITGVNDVVKDKNNSFFPNPTEDGIWMNAPMAGEFAVYTITGKCVYKQMLNQTQVYIDFHTLPSGTYITKLTGRDRILTEVLVKL